MNCTCYKRQYPCPIHGEKGLPQTEHTTIHTIVIQVYSHWPKGSTNQDDIKWGATVTKDAIQIHDTGPVCVAKEAALCRALAQCV